MSGKTGVGFFAGVFVLLASLCLFSLSSCNGNGGSVDGEGELYGGSDSSSAAAAGASVSSSGLSSSGSLSAQDIISYSSSGDTDSILNLVSGSGSGASSASSTTVALSASDLGLPPGGSVTLAIAGSGVSYAAQASASSDGNVYFTIPRIASGTEVTVSVVVKAADGSVSASGSKTQTVTDSSSLVNVTLTDGSGSLVSGSGTVYTIPSFSVQVTPPAGASAHAGTTGGYDISDVNGIFTFTAVPSSGSFPPGTTFEWVLKNAYGMLFPISFYGESISISAYVGGVTAEILSSQEAKSFSVYCTASNSKAAGSLSGTPATVALYKPDASSSGIPDFTVHIDSYPGEVVVPDSTYCKVIGGSSVGVKVLSDGALPENGSGASFIWKVNGAVVKTTTSKETSFTMEDAHIVVAGLPEYAVGAALSDDSKYTISCTIRYDDSAEGKDSNPSSTNSDTMILYR